MILNGALRPGNRPGSPWLVWLHGFLGSGAEWAPLASAFSDWPQLLLDLPGHGASAAQRVDGFPAMSAVLQATLAHYQINDYWLVGYSLGGRIAMYHACYGHTAGLRGIVIEGGNPGLPIIRRAVNGWRRTIAGRHVFARSRWPPYWPTGIASRYLLP